MADLTKEQLAYFNAGLTALCEQHGVTLQLQILVIGKEDTGPTMDATEASVEAPTAPVEATPEPSA